MKKFILMVSILMTMIISLTACSGIKTSKSYTFSLSTGDKVNVELDTTDGYNINSKSPFEISLKKKVLSIGKFISEEEYKQFLESLKLGNKKVKIIDSGKKDSNEYIFYIYDNKEYNILMLLGKSKVGIILGNNVSKESAKEVFDKLTITVEK